MSALPKTRRGHTLLTPATCPCNPHDDRSCNVCDGGLGVCMVCGAAECELDERDCKDDVEVIDIGHGSEVRQ